jgi:hypothetical protein
MTDRQSYRQRVERLLEEIGDDTRTLRRLTTWGVKLPGLSEQKEQLARARSELAQLIAG